MDQTKAELWRIRAARPSDGPALADLEAKHPDSGGFGLAFRYRVDALQAQQALRPGSVAVVAEAVSGGEIVGMGFATVNPGRWAGALRTVGMIYGLVVEASWRRLGIASGLYQALVEHIRSVGGPDAVVLAGVQADNEGSRRAAPRWANQAILGRTKLVMAGTPARAPAAVPGVTLRAAEPRDWPAIAAGLTTCHGHLALSPGFDGAALAALYGAEPFGAPLRGYLVAEADGRLVAGLGILFDSQVETGHFQSIPPVFRFLNLFLRLLPRDGVLKRLVAKDLWFTPGDDLGVRALVALWREAPWRWRELGNSLMFFTDRNGPLGNVLPVNPLLPDAGGWLMVSSEPPLDLSQPFWLPM